MSNKSLAIVVAICTVVVLMLLAINQKAQTPQKLVAFTATATELNFDRTHVATPLAVRNVIYAVRSDGSKAEARLQPDPSDVNRTVYLRKIVDRAAAKRLFIDPISESIVTYALPKNTAMSVQPTEVCPGERAGQLLGYDVYVSEKKDAGADLAITTWHWSAPALDCFPLRTRIETVQQGNPPSIQERVVNTVTQADPPAWLFDIPTTYTERKPSEVLREQARRYPNMFKEPRPESTSGLDAGYGAQRP